MPVVFGPGDPLLEELQIRAPFLPLQAPEGEPCTIPGASFLRLFAGSFRVASPQRNLRAWAVSWKPESVGRAFQALVDSGLPREACKDLGEFLVLTKKHLRRQLMSGQVAAFTLGIDDLFFHQEEPGWFSKDHTRGNAGHGQ